MIKALRMKAADWLARPYQGRSNWSGLFRTIQTPRMGSEELLAAYGEMPWLRAVSSKIGQAVGNTTWKVYTPAPKSKVRTGKLKRSALEQRQAMIAKEAEQGALVELDAHPLIDLLEFGGPVLSGPALLQITSVQLDLVGESFWMLERNAAGDVLSVWNAPPTAVIQLPSTGSPYYIVMVGTERKEVPIADMLFFKDPNPAAPYERGSGLARALADELEIGESASKYLKGFFQNSARPDMIISGDGLHRGDTGRLEEAWVEKHRGPHNSHKVSFLSRKVDVHEVGHSFEAMQLTELRKAERDAVMQVFGVPPEMFGVLSNSNRSTIGAADYFWNRHIITPRVERLRATLQRQLAPLYGADIILDYESPITEDNEFILKVMQANPSAFSQNEWRYIAERESLGAKGEVFPAQTAPAEPKPKPKN